MTVAVAVRRLAGMTGSAALVLAQLRWLAGAGHRVDLLGERLPAAAVAAAGGHVQRFIRWPGTELARRRGFARRVARHCRRRGYALVVGHGDTLAQDVLFLHNLVAREAELLGGAGAAEREAVMAFHQEMFARGEYRLVVTPSRLARAELLQRYALPDDAVQVIYPGYDPARFDAAGRDAARARVRPALGVAGECLLGFVTSGNFPLRGADILVACLGLLPAGLRPGIRVLAVGAPHNTAALASEFAAAGLGQLLICRDKTAAVADYLHACDLLVHPARLETFGLVALEAAACGTPVLTSAAVGAAELLPVPADLAVSTPVAGAFAASLASLLQSPGRLGELARRQHEAARAQTLAAYAARCGALFTTLGLSAPANPNAAAQRKLCNDSQGGH